MERVLAAAVLGGALLSQMAATPATAQDMAISKAVVHNGSGGVSSALPPMPRGKSTILGGEIRNVDQVMDRLTLRVFGQKPIKILFDERTQVYRDGTRIPLHDLAACDHASVQTTLDGTDVFAVSVHILSGSPTGDYEGQVLSYNQGTGELTVASSAGSGSFKLLVSGSTAFKRAGQTAFSSGQSGPSDLAHGALVAAKFQSDKEGRGVATEITILATPGSSFVFSGNIASLDMHSGLLVLIDPRDDIRYQVHFDPARVPSTQNLHAGDQVRVEAEYDGSRYVASAVTSN